MYIFILLKHILHKSDFIAVTSEMAPIFRHHSELLGKFTRNNGTYVITCEHTLFYVLYFHI